MDNIIIFILRTLIPTVLLIIGVIGIVRGIILLNKNWAVRLTKFINDMNRVKTAVNKTTKKSFILSGIWSIIFGTILLIVWLIYSRLVSS